MHLSSSFWPRQHSNRGSGSGEHPRHPHHSTAEGKRHKTDPSIAPFRAVNGALTKRYGENNIQSFVVVSSGCKASRCSSLLIDNGMCRGLLRDWTTYFTIHAKVVSFDSNSTSNSFPVSFVKSAHNGRPGCRIWTSSQQFVIVFYPILRPSQVQSIFDKHLCLDWIIRDTSM